MKVEHASGTYFIDGRPSNEYFAKALHPVECQRALAESLLSRADEIRSNPKAIKAAVRNADELVRKAELLILSAKLDELCEIEWGVRQLHG